MRPGSRDSWGRSWEGELDGGDERAVGGDVTVCHAGRVEGEAGVAFAVEKDETAGGAGAVGEEVNGFTRGHHCVKIFATGRTLRILGIAFGNEADGYAGRLFRKRTIVLRRGYGAQKVHGGFGHDDFHDGFAVAGAGDAASGGIGVAAATDERRIAHATGEFAAGAAGGGGCEELASRIERDGADSALLVAAMVGSGVFVLAAKEPGFAFGVSNEIRGIAQSDAAFFSEAFGALADEHHVRAVLEDSTREADGIADVLQSGDSARAQGRAIHDDGIAFDAAVEIQMRAETSVENGVVFEDDDSRFDGVERGAASGENGPPSIKSAVAAGSARVDGFVRNVPSAAMDNQSGFHREENGKARRECPERGGAAVFIRLDEEIEKEENRAEEQKDERGIDMPPREPPERSEKLGRNGLQAGLFADAIKRTNDRVAGKAAAEGAELVVRPDEEVFTLSPSESCAEGKGEITQECKKPEARA